MELKKQFGNDPKKSVEGVWFDFDETTRVLVARSNNAKFQGAMRKKLAPHKIAIRTGTLSEVMAKKIMTEVMAETILLGWEGITENGVPVSYTPEVAAKYLGDPDLDDFRAAVIGFSEEAASFREQQLEGDAKN